MENIKMLVDQFDFGNKNVSNEKALEMLRRLRKSKISRPDIIVACGLQAVAASGDVEVWAVLEQVAVAALQMQDVDLASECLSKLRNQFPKSHRVSRLTALHAEATGDFDSAITIYDAVLAECPADVACFKRKAAIFKAQGNQAMSIVELNKVIKSIAMADSAIWIELSEMYIASCDFEYAAFALEELVLMEPNNPHYHAHLAEAYYTLGGSNNLVKARKHYAMSLQAQHAAQNRRALFGLVYTCESLLKLLEEGSSDLAVSTELLSWGKDQLRDLTKSSKSHSLDTVMLGVLACE